MTFWLDAQLPPALAQHLAKRFGIEAIAVRDLGLRDAGDRAIFDAARLRQAAVITKDNDFVDLLERLGPPPRIVWVTCGNSSNAHLRGVFDAAFGDALKLLEAGAALVEIADAPARP
ncbi:MAG: DUF5615 family PIN-like protein [Bryobacterales bacterium]|nr:DUF5615 family PIN-like protein [Bryobacterales bacterium]